MERAAGLHDLPDDRKARHTSRFEARGPLLQIDRILNVLGDDEVGIARAGGPGERDDEVCDRPSLLGREGVEERRHRRAIQARAHRPEDILAGRASPEGPTLREVRRAYRIAPVVHQGWSRRSVAPTDRPVTLHAAVLLVELLPERDGFVRAGRRARERHGLGDILGVREVGREGCNEVGEIRHFLVGEGRPGGHRGVGHATPDDVDEVLMGRERSVGSRPNLVHARREVAGPGAEMRGGISFAIPLLAVALRTVLKVEPLARLPLRLCSDVGSLRAHRSRRRGTQHDDEDSETSERARTDQTGGHFAWASSFARGFWPVKS